MTSSAVESELGGHWNDDDDDGGGRAWVERDEYEADICASNSTQSVVKCIIYTTIVYVLSTRYTKVTMSNKY